MDRSAHRWRKVLRRCSLLLLALAIAAPAAGQDAGRAALLRAARQEKAAELRRPEPPGRLERLFGRAERLIEGRVEGGGGPTGILGFSPIAGGLKPGAGLSGGVRIAPLSPDRGLLVEVDAVASTRRYWSVSGRAGYRTARHATFGYARHWHLAGERFYGRGPDSNRDDRSEYRLDESVAGGLAHLSIGAGLQVGGGAAYRVARPGPGRAVDVPDAVDTFAGAVPSLLAESRHVAAGGWIAIDRRDPGSGSDVIRTATQAQTPTESDISGMPLATDRGFYAKVELTHYAGVGATTSDLSRLTVQSQQYVPFRRGRNVFAFREYLALTGSNAEHVPIFMLPALGGAYTLRGYDLFRFSDRNALLLNAEYRWQIWHLLDLALFVDAGQVFAEARDLLSGRLEGSYGVGIRLRAFDRGIGRIDLGRSEEGTQIHVRLGTTF